MTPHKQWLDNEYAQWIKALGESTVHNFKEHPMVRRMLSLGMNHDGLFNKEIAPFHLDQLYLIRKIDAIGYDKHLVISDACSRMIYYAQQILKLNPTSICEIGGGVGQFYAILLALGYRGYYYIYDLPEVKEFQRKYLSEVFIQTGIQTYETTGIRYEMVVSFYAFAEFDDYLKAQYWDMINATKHGYITWSPHSGASDDLSFFKHNITVTPGIEEGVRIIQW